MVSSGGLGEVDKDGAEEGLKAAEERWVVMVVVVAGLLVVGLRDVEGFAGRWVVGRVARVVELGGVGVMNWCWVVPRCDKECCCRKVRTEPAPTA